MTTTLSDLIARRDELLIAAFDGCLETLRDATAPATAKATATSNAIRLHEMLSPKDGGGKEQSEMSYDELVASVAELRKIAPTTQQDE